MRTLLIALLLAGCAQHNDSDQLNRMEAQLNRIEAKEQAQIPAPMTKQEYEVMPAGTRFLAPDGTTRVKVSKGK